MLPIWAVVFLKQKMDESQDSIAVWIAKGQDMKAAHLIVAYDARTGRQFPVYVMPGESLERKRETYKRDYYDYVTEYKL